MRQTLFDTSLQIPVWGHKASMLCSVWDVWRGMILGSDEFCSLSPVPGPSTLWGMEERSSCRDLQRYLQRYLPTRAEEQHTKAIDKQRVPSCTDILVFVPQGPSYLFLHDFLTFLFFVYFSLFQGELKKMDWDCGVPWVLPFLSLALCCKRTCHPLVLSWHCAEHWLWKSRSSKSPRKSNLWSATWHHRWCAITESGTALFSQGLPLISNLAKQNKIKQKFSWSI